MTIYAYYDQAIDAFATVNIQPEGVEFAAFDDVEEVDANALYIKDGEIKLRPARPHPWLTFDPDAEAWVDLRTISDWSAQLYTLRAAASMSRVDFVIKCVAAGVLSRDDGMVAAAGQVPPSLQAIIDGIPDEMAKFEAEIRWASATVIDRLNPLIISMAAFIGADEWVLDELFGITWPPPLASWPEGQLHP